MHVLYVRTLHELIIIVIMHNYTHKYISCILWRHCTFGFACTSQTVIKVHFMHFIRYIDHSGPVLFCELNTFINAFNLCIIDSLHSLMIKISQYFMNSNVCEVCKLINTSKFILILWLINIIYFCHHMRIMLKTI